MGQDSEKTSRLSQRSFGVTNRIWLIVSLFLFIVVLTHFALPTQHLPEQPYSAANLNPKNYLNGSDTEPNPFEFCPPYGPGDHLGVKYGTQVLSKSRMHLGSGDRIQHVLNRALAGLPVTISILGGSGTVHPSYTSTSTANRSRSSFGLPWRWRRPDISKMLSFHVLPLVEQRLPQPRNRTHKWCHATY
jgi:hypothetical protein